MLLIILIWKMLLMSYVYSLVGATPAWYIFKEYFNINFGHQRICLLSTFMKSTHSLDQSAFKMQLQLLFSHCTIVIICRHLLNTDVSNVVISSWKCKGDTKENICYFEFLSRLKFAFVTAYLDRGLRDISGKNIRAFLFCRGLCTI